MEEYNIKIEHIKDGKKVGTDYVTVTHEEYVRIMRIILEGI